MRPRRIVADLVIFGKGYLRNPLGLFFSIFFPLILVAIFGLIFSSMGSTTITLYTENLDHHSNASEAFLAGLNQTPNVKVQLVNPTDVANDCSCNFSHWLAIHDYPAGLVIPDGYGAAVANRTVVDLTVLTNPSDSYSTGVAVGSVEAVVTQINLNLAGGTAVVGVSTASVAGTQYTAIDYLVPGLIGFSILTSPMFAMVDISSSYRKDHLFRQLSLTPLTKGEWLVAKVIWYIGLSFVSAGVMVATGVFLFHAHVTLSVYLVPMLVLGPFFFVALGMLAGSVAKTPETAAIIGNIITFPMMFLAGTFFPVANFPPYLQTVAHVLPLYYVIDGMNQIMLFQNPAGSVVDVLVVLVGSVVVFIAAITAFKWRDE